MFPTASLVSLSPRRNRKLTCRSAARSMSNQTSLVRPDSINPDQDTEFMWSSTIPNCFGAVHVTSLSFASNLRGFPLRLTHAAFLKRSGTKSQSG